MKTLSIVLLIFGMILLRGDTLPPKSGDDLGTITTTTGTVYTGAKLQAVDSDGITILDTDGGAKIAFEKLPADLQKKFGYDPTRTVPYVEVQKYKERIAQLENENAQLRLTLSKFKGALSDAQNVGKDANAAKQGYIYFFNYLTNQWQLRTGHFSVGPCKGMFLQEAQGYVQQQWQDLAPSERADYEKRAQMYGAGPDPSVLPPDDNSGPVNVRVLQGQGG